MAEHAQRERQKEVAEGDGAEHKNAGIPLIVQLLAPEGQLEDADLTDQRGVLDEEQEEAEGADDETEPAEKPEEDGAEAPSEDSAEADKGGDGE